MKVNKKIILTLFIMLLTIFCISGKVEATYSATSKTVKSGANVSITIKSTEKLENFDVAYTDAGGLTYKSCSTAVTGAVANSKNGKISYALYGGQATTLGTYNFTAPKVTEKTKYTFVCFHPAAQQGGNFLCSKGIMEFHRRHAT